MVSQARTFRDYPESFQAITKARLFGIPFDVYLTIVIVILVSIVFYQTKWGTRVVALGGNEEALRLAGVGTRRLKTLVYTTCGFFTAIATIVMVSKANSMQSSFGPGTEFTALTAAIVGGVSFLGGEREHTCPSRGRVRARRARQWHAVGWLESVRPVHRARHHPAGRSRVRRVSEGSENEDKAQVITSGSPRTTSLQSPAIWCSASGYPALRGAAVRWPASGRLRTAAGRREPHRPQVAGYPLRARLGGPGARYLLAGDR